MTRFNFYPTLFAAIMAFPTFCQANIACNKCLWNCVKNPCNMTESCIFNFPLGGGAETFGLNNNKTPSTLDGILVDYNLNYIATIADVDASEMTNFYPMSTHIQFSESFTNSATDLVEYWTGNGTEFPYEDYAKILEDSSNRCVLTYGYYAWGFSEKEWPVSCQSGSNQSPVNFPIMTGSANQNISLDFSGFNIYPSFIVNNIGTTLDVFTSTSTNHIILDSVSTVLQRINFRMPSEHLIGGLRFPLEIQFIFQNRIFISVFYVLSHESNSELVKIMSVVDAVANLGTQFVSDSLDLKKLMGIDGGSAQFYRYNGTQTTPPCNPAEWLVKKSPEKIKPDDYQKLLTLRRCTSTETFGVVANFHWGNARSFHEIDDQMISTWSWYA